MTQNGPNRSEESHQLKIAQIWTSIMSTLTADRCPEERRAWETDCNTAREEELEALHARVRAIVEKKERVAADLRERLAAAEARAREAEEYLHRINDNLQDVAGGD